MEKYTLSIGTINKVLGYLGQAPYQQVAGLVQELQAELSDQMTANSPDVKEKACKKES